MDEVEYIVAFFASCESIWLQKQIPGLFDKDLDTAVILCDNQSCINMTENPTFHDKSKLIKNPIFLHTRYGTEGSYKAPICEYR